MGSIFAAVEEGHDQPDANAEYDRQDDTGDSDIDAQSDTRVGNGQNVDGRADEQEGDGRTQPGSLGVDAGEQGQDCAGTDSQYESAQRRHGIRNPARGVAAQVAGYGFLGDQGHHGTGDEKGRHQAKQNMGGQVGRQAAHA